ncbi:MAG: hypothetical protein ABL956_13705 [Hyphomonadaceae bacterium]
MMRAVHRPRTLPSGLGPPQFGLLADIASVPDDTFGTLASDLSLDPLHLHP